VASTPGDEVRDMATVDVFVPYDAGTDGVSDGLVEVQLPQAPILAAVQRTSQLLALGASGLLLLVGLVLVMSRRKLRLRDHQGAHDRLTGLLNWDGFRDAVATVSAAKRSDTLRAGALLVLDLDGFKLVNDTLGHPAGDALLQQVGVALLQAAGPHDLVARLGGDEFAVHMTGLVHADAAEVIAHTIVEQIRSHPFTVDGIDLRVDVSIGIAHAPDDGTDADALIRCADIAMYRAKRMGTGVATYEKLADARSAADLGLLGQLGAAIDNDELVLHYQPKAAMTGRAIKGVEALVRWQHPELGLVPPSGFIALAENTGLITPLTQWVLRSAVAQAARWMADGLWLPVAVNVSPRSLLEPGLVTYIIDLLADAGLPPSLLEIEITESAIMADPDRAACVLRQMRALGLHIFIDDFGTGYTSLAYLETLPADVLKIDRTFITDLTEDDKREAITRSVIDLAHRLGLTAIAEGVETEAIWLRLVELGCDEGQGYHLAKPMPGADIRGWIAARIDAPSSRSSEVRVPASL
jgi:diguanylate cyclase (GGDEF)-like protein